MFSEQIAMLPELSQRTGLREEDLRMIIDTLSGKVDNAWIFGSRAKGTHHKGSDIDIAVSGDGLTQDIVLLVSDILNEELPMPYFFDVVLKSEISNQELLEHIERVAVPILG